MPPLYALRAFEVAARLGSFTQAAQSLFITQSAVSRHVKTLEEHLDCQLFERHGSRLVLTDAGRLLAQELKIGFRTIENACVAVTRQRGALRLKAPSTLTMRWRVRPRRAPLGSRSSCADHALRRETSDTECGWLHCLRTDCSHGSQNFA